MLDNFAQSAKTLTLVAIIIEAIFTALFALYFTLFLSLFAITPATPGIPANSGFIIFGFIGAIFGGIGLLWVLLDYFLVYKRLSEGNIMGAKDTSLILGIIQLIFGGIVPGILLIVAYTQLGNSVHFAGHQQQS